MDMLFLDNLNIPMESVMSVAAEHSGVSTLIGTTKEVQARLGRSHADRVLLQRQDRESLERLAEVLVPRTPPSPRLLKEAAMLVQTRKAVLESGDWLTAAEVAQLAGLSPRNPSAQPNKWKKQGLIFAIPHNGGG